MKYKTFQHDVVNRILTLTLDRPDRLNAFTTQMGEELIDAFQNASENDDIGAVIVTGAGKAFCAGMDLATDGNVFGVDESLQPTMADLRDRFDDEDVRIGVRDDGGKLTLTIFECKKPVIAAINGPAVGIGATMTLAMDFRMASQQARVGFVFAKLGIVPEACSTWFLPRLVGPQQALEWVYSAEMITADAGLRAGLFRSVHEPEDLLEQARELALRLITDRSPVAVALTRQMMLRNAALPHPVDAHRVESLSMFYTSREDGKEGVAAFMDKRPPAFTSRASQMPPFYPWDR